MNTQSTNLSNEGYYKGSVGLDIQACFETFIRLSMIAIFLIFGLHKFSAYEANAIAGLALNSPFLSGLHGVLGVQGFSNLIGTTEITAAVLLAAGFYSARLGVIVGLLAVGTYLVTLSFLFTTPGVTEASMGGFPYLSVMPGQFLVKDLVLLAVSFWLLAASVQARQTET